MGIVKIANPPQSTPIRTGSVVGSVRFGVGMDFQTLTHVEFKANLGSRSP